MEHGFYNEDRGRGRGFGEDGRFINPGDYEGQAHRNRPDQNVRGSNIRDSWSSSNRDEGYGMNDREVVPWHNDEDSGWPRHSRDWNTGGGFDDRRDINSNWTVGGWGTAGRPGNFNMDERPQDFGGQGQRNQGRGSGGLHGGRGPKGYQRTDERIKEDVCDYLTRDQNVDASDIEVEVKQGEVTLTGTVSERKQKRFAEDTIQDIPGIKEIHNRIRVQQSEAFQSPGGAQQSTQA